MDKEQERSQAVGSLQTCYQWQVAVRSLVSAGLSGPISRHFGRQSRLTADETKALGCSLRENQLKIKHQSFRLLSAL